MLYLFIFVIVNDIQVVVIYLISWNSKLVTFIKAVFNFVWCSFYLAYDVVL